MLVMGIDLGTSGVRAVICTGEGSVVAQAAARLEGAEVSGLPAKFHEQHAERWWPATRRTIRTALAALAGSGDSPEAIAALSISATSGTVLPLGVDDQPLRPALMYNDGRSAKETDELNALASDFSSRMGRRFQPSFALPKMLWVRRHEPEVFAQTARWVHAADFLVGHLTGDYGVSDYSTALKTGYDLIDQCWPRFIEDQAGLPLAMLPRVVAPGARIAAISPAGAEETGLATSTLVCGGMTDATAALLAAGAADPGEWNTVLGTTMAIKGVTTRLIRDAQDRVYCHLHPQGYWLPGAASNVGGECLEVYFPGRDLAHMDRQAEAHGQSSVVVYPLTRKGERFPFLRPEAESFILGQPEGEADLYRGYLEGVGLAERMAYEVLASLGADIGARIYATGGGSKSKLWLQIRADILGRQILKPKTPESAFGAAILAASETLYSNVTEAVRRMVHLESTTDPQVEQTRRYDAKYARLAAACKARGYID